MPATVLRAALACRATPINEITGRHLAWGTSAPPQAQRRYSLLIVALLGALCYRCGIKTRCFAYVVTVEGLRCNDWDLNTVPRLPQVIAAPSILGSNCRYWNARATNLALVGLLKEVAKLVRPYRRGTREAISAVQGRKDLVGGGGQGCLETVDELVAGGPVDHQRRGHEEPVTEAA